MALMQSLRNGSLVASHSCQRVQCLQLPHRLPARGRRVLAVRALFGFFNQKSVAPSPKTAELCDELIETVGSRAPAADVDDLVRLLQPLSTKNPTRSKQLYGEWELIYTSKPSGSTKLRQVIEEPDQIEEVSESKTLGLFSTITTQLGELNAVTSTAYEEVYSQLDVKGPLGSQNRDIDVTRGVELLFLGPKLRIVEIKAQSGDDTLVIYKRIEQETDVEEDEEEDTKSFFPFGGQKEGTATVAERQVRKKMAEQGAKEGPRMPANLPSSPTALLAGGGPPRLALKAPESKGKGLSPADQQLEQLEDELREAISAAKQAKDAERAAGAKSKSAAGAMQQLQTAGAQVAAVEREQAAAQAARAEAEAQLKKVSSDLSAIQSKLKSTLAAGPPRK